jgi:hypothetical protein
VNRSATISPGRNRGGLFTCGPAGWLQGTGGSRRSPLQCGETWRSSRGFPGSDRRQRTQPCRRRGPRSRRTSGACESIVPIRPGSQSRALGSRAAGPRRTPADRACSPLLAVRPEVSDDLLHHPAVDLVVALNLPHQVDLPHRDAVLPCLRRGAPRPTMAPSPSVGPSAQQVSMSPCACIAFPMAFSPNPSAPRDPRKNNLRFGAGGRVETRSSRRNVRGEGAAKAVRRGAPGTIVDHGAPSARGRISAYLRGPCPRNGVVPGGASVRGRRAAFRGFSRPRVFSSRRRARCSSTRAGSRTAFRSGGCSTGRSTRWWP